MIKITIPAGEFYDEKSGEFIYFKETSLSLEHSLLSISKWESKWHKPFLSKLKTDSKTNEEVIDYIRCMTITQGIPESAYYGLTEDNIKTINKYIQNPMTATTVKDDGKRSSEIVTSELIYYWMVALEIPFECEKWHINRLLTLIKICNAKNKPGKKMGRKATMKRNSSLNAARRKRMGSKG